MRRQAVPEDGCSNWKRTPTDNSYRIIDDMPEPAADVMIKAAFDRALMISKSLNSVSTNRRVDLY